MVRKEYSGTRYCEKFGVFILIFDLKTASLLEHIQVIKAQSGGRFEKTR